MISTPDNAAGSRKEQSTEATEHLAQQHQQQKQQQVHGESAETDTPGPLGSERKKQELEGAERDAGRPFLLFSQQELPSQETGAVDSSDEDYEMTTADYQALLSATKAKAAKVLAGTERFRRRHGQRSG